MPPVKKPKRTWRPAFFRQWREFRGDPSQIKVSEGTNISQSTISRLEKGDTKYDQDTLEVLAEYFSCEPVELLSVNPLLPKSKIEHIYDLLKQASPSLLDQIYKIVKALVDGEYRPSNNG